MVLSKRGVRFTFAEGQLVYAEYARKKSEFFLSKRGVRFSFLEGDLVNAEYARKKTEFLY
jgi:hypothetical protein